MIAALYDIHGNLPALEAVLAEVRREGADLVVIGGDVMPGPMSRECLAMLRALEVPVQLIRGNGERVVLAARAGEDISVEVPEPFREVIHWSAAQLDDDTARWVSTWPATLRLTADAMGVVLFCHASPRNDSEIFTRTTSAARLEPVFAGANAPVVVCGHTHMQFDRQIGNTRVVNAGSVGMSFQGVGAYWLQIGDGLRLRRTEYDVHAAAERVRATKYPQAAAFAANHILQPPTEAMMLETFGKAEMK
jgi:putative phosphoesterase